MIIVRMNTSISPSYTRNQVLWGRGRVGDSGNWKSPVWPSCSPARPRSSATFWTPLPREGTSGEAAPAFSAQEHRETRLKNLIIGTLQGSVHNLCKVMDICAYVKCNFLHTAKMSIEQGLLLSAMLAFFAAPLSSNSVGIVVCQS